MKKFSSLLVLSFVFLTACGSAPLTEEEQAAKYGMTVEKYRQEQEAAARMNMSWEEHVKMLEAGEPMDHGNMQHN